MIPNVVRGGRMNGVMAYLVGPGRSNEHVNPHLIAGDDRVTFSIPVGSSLDANQGFEIGYMLDQPRRIHEAEFNIPVYARDEESGEFLKDETGKKIRTGSKPGHVWHCSLAVESGHGRVSDEQWEKIATEFVIRMGFIDPDGAKSSRWAAVHHGASKNGNDHIHLVVQLVREDGTKSNINNDFHRAQTVCRELEKEFGLPRLESQEHGKGLAGEKPAERARADRGNNTLSDKFELRRRLRAALSTSNDAEQYVRHAQDLGVHVAPSFKPGSNTEVRGYKVSLGGRGTGERGIWYAPSKLDSTLAWNDIHARFGDANREAGDAYLVSLHSSNTGQERRKAVAHPVSNEQLERMMSHMTGPDTLANIYARLSLQFERNKPATFQRLSVSYARAAQGPGNLRYAARMNQRFATGQGRGWVAVAKQAGRVGRVMLEHQMTQDRPQFSGNVDRLLKDAEGIINREMQRIHKEESASVVAAKTPSVPYREWNAGPQHGSGSDQGFER